jgi:hypothetical protein
LHWILTMGRVGRYKAEAIQLRAKNRQLVAEHSSQMREMQDRLSQLSRDDQPQPLCSSAPTPDRPMAKPQMTTMVQPPPAAADMAVVSMRFTQTGPLGIGFQVRQAALSRVRCSIDAHQ